MHHSQLEYLVAVQKLQRQDRGAKGYERTIRLTPLGEQVMEEYLAAARSMGKFLCSCGADEGDVKGDAVRCVCALTGSTRQALVKAHTAQNG